MEKDKIDIELGNVTVLTLQLASAQNKMLLRVADTLDKIDATLIRMEGKYDANQEAKSV